jgi:hypothetical protein
MKRSESTQAPACPIVNKARVGAIIKNVKKLAVAYYRETGKPLGVTGEVAEWEAARVLGLKLCKARQDGYDAIQDKSGRFKRISIKGRRILEASKPGQRLGSIRLKHEWDSVVLVLLDEDFEPKAMYEAERADIQRELLRPESRARNERGALSINKFKSISKQVWKAK